MDDQQVYPTATWSIRQVLDAVRRMPTLFALTVIATVVVTIVSFAKFPKDPKDWDLNFFLLSAIASALNALILTPMIIAVHRFVILGEVTKLFAPHVFSWRFVHFLSLSFVYQAMFFAIALPLALFGYSAVPIVAAIVLFFIAVWLGSRILLVFPAAATDAPGASLRNAFADSQGEAWGIFATLFMIGLLLVLLSLGISALIALIFIAGATTIAGLLELLNKSIQQVVTVMAFAAAASHIYLGLGERLKTSAPENL